VTRSRIRKLHQKTRRGMAEGKRNLVSDPKEDRILKSRDQSVKGREPSDLVESLTTVPGRKQETSTAFPVDGGRPVPAGK